MEIKLKLDTEKASKADMAIAAAYGLCRVSADNEYPQLTATNTVPLIVIIVILYDPRLAPNITKSTKTRKNMVEACYTVRATTKQQVLAKIRKLTLQTNENGQYTHDATLLLEKDIWRVLQSQFNLSNLGKGMEKLLGTGDNQLTLVMSTDAITTGSVIKEAKLHSEARSTLTGTTVLPTITARAETQEEANRLNVINQAVIGAKEGAANAITKLVDGNITNAILHTPDGRDYMGVNDFRLFDVTQAAIDGADRPLTNDVLEQLLEVINHTFNFCK
jgi:hypothetical protein